MKRGCNWAHATAKSVNTQRPIEAGDRHVVSRAAKAEDEERGGENDILDFGIRDQLGEDGFGERDLRQQLAKFT